MDAKKPFDSDRVISIRINDAEFNTYFVGFDINDKGENKYRWNDLVNTLQKVILEFAFGYNPSINSTDATEKLCDAAKSVYKIKEFEEVKKLYKNGDHIADDDTEKEYLRRGEFGELILHLLLRDYHETIPLISKIYFKDSNGVTVHGFDAVHIQPKNKSLWLGESKLYIDGKKGIKALIRDIKSHIRRDYLHDEFTLISKKLKNLDNIPKKEYWIDLINKKNKLADTLKSVTIPLLCVYTSANFSNFDKESEEFFKAYDSEVKGLKKYFDEHNDHPMKTKLNIILLLFPVKCKNELVNRMHKKLAHLQGIENES